MKNITIVLVLTLLLGCGYFYRNSQEDLITSQLDWLLRTDPHAAFIDAVGASDFRYYGVYGSKNYIPFANIQCSDIQNTVIFITGTSEVLTSYKQQQLQSLAELFAEEFNSRMLEHRQKLNLDDCDV